MKVICLNEYKLKKKANSLLSDPYYNLSDYDIYYSEEEQVITEEELLAQIEENRKPKYVDNIIYLDLKMLKKN